MSPDTHVLFRAMFTGELAESRQTEVVIRDIDERAMELLIDFAYTSQVTRVAAKRVKINLYVCTYEMQIITTQVFTYFTMKHLNHHW